MDDPKKPKEAPQLAPTAMQLAEYGRETWRARVERGITPEMVLDPAFWSHQAIHLKPTAKIEVMAEDGTWYAEYLVTDCSRTWAKVVLILGPINLTSSDVSLTQAGADAYLVKLRGPKKWSVIRKQDGAVVAEDLGTKDAAADWLKEHLSTVAT